VLPPKQLKQLLSGPAAARPSVVDLREAEELAAAKLPGGGVTHLPLRHGVLRRAPCALRR
jgi:rhodanese-related sulfurtransferase